jgi:hypothetical protein
VSSATAVPARRGSVLAAGRLPDLLDAHRVEDRGRDLGVLPGGDEEANVALPAGGEEPGRAPRRVGTDDERSLDGDGLVSRLVAGGDRPGQLSDRLIEHGDVVGHGVRAGVARTQHPRKRLTGASAKKNIGWKPKPPLEVGSGLLVALRVDLDERGVDVDDDRRRSRRRRGPGPDLLSHCRHRRRDRTPHRSVDLVEGPVHRRVRGHRAEQRGLEAQVLDVRTGLPAAGEHERHLGEDLAPVVDRHLFATGWNRTEERVAEPETIAEGAQRVEPDVGDHPRAAGFHLHRRSAVTVHLGSALLVGNLSLRIPTVFATGRAVPRRRAGQLTEAREGSGLGAPRLPPHGASL